MSTHTKNYIQRAKETGKIQLLSLATPNGIKIGAALEELGLPYEPHTIDITKNEQFAPEFLEVSPNNRIPAIVDPNVEGEPITIFESGAILIHLAEKTGKLIPTDWRQRKDTIQWLFWQVGGVGPMFGQYNHFSKYAPEKIPYGIERYEKESQRLLGVLEKQLIKTKSFIASNEYTIADIATWPWIRTIDIGYKNLELLKDFPHVQDWLKRCLDRPASQRALNVTPFPPTPPQNK